MSERSQILKHIREERVPILSFSREDSGAAGRFWFSGPP